MMHRRQLRLAATASPTPITTIMGLRRISKELLQPFILFPNSPTPTTARGCGGSLSSASCLQRRQSVPTAAPPTSLQLHRRQFLLSSDYFFSPVATSRRRRHLQQRSNIATRQQHHQSLTPSLLSTTRRASSSSNNSNYDMNIVISTEELQSNILHLAKSMSDGLSQLGYWTNNSPFHDILPPHVIATLRNQAISLRNEGRYEPSYSESVINAHTGETIRFDKPGVFACEPDGADYETAPDMLLYMSMLLQTLPPALNANMNMIGDGSSSAHWKLDNTAFNAKLAVTQSGGSKYPRHVDNVHGIQVGSNDLRKLTAILYLNPSWTCGDGGELRIYLDPNNKESDDGNNRNREKEVFEPFVDLSPVGGRLVLFYSDEVPHEVLENAPRATVENDNFDRYALTIWIPVSPVV